jgi:hypothetical protein
MPGFFAAQVNVHQQHVGPGGAQQAEGVGGVVHHVDEFIAQLIDHHAQHVGVQVVIFYGKYFNGVQGRYGSECEGLN